MALFDKDDATWREALRGLDRMEGDMHQRMLWAPQTLNHVYIGPHGEMIYGGGGGGAGGPMIFGVPENEQALRDMRALAQLEREQDAMAEKKRKAAALEKADREAQASKMDEQCDYVLLDHSGSMRLGGRYNKTIAGINAYVRGIFANDAVRDTRVNVFGFQGGYPMRFTGLRRDVGVRDWKELSPAEAKPDYGTPLYSAILKLVEIVMGDDPTKAAIVIVTDGVADFDERQWRDAAKAALDRCRDKGWQIVFLGADFDNFGQNEIMGGPARQALSYTSTNTMAAMGLLASTRAAYAATGQMMSFSDEQKAAVAAKT